MTTPDNGAGDPAGHDCIEGHASTTLQDQNCNNNMHYACIPKWKGVDGALAPGTTPGSCPLASSLMGSGLPWDVCNRNTCRAWGDPHVDGFDGNRNDVYGGAIYSLSETTDYSENTLGLPPFKIAMETRQERHVAFIKKLFFTFPSNTGQSTYKITFTEQGDSYIALNGGADLNLDAQDNTDFRFAKEGNRLEVDTWLGITVTLQGVDATIVVPPFYSQGVVLLK